MSNQGFDGGPMRPPTPGRPPHGPRPPQYPPGPQGPYPPPHPGPYPPGGNPQPGPYPPGQYPPPPQPPPPGPAGFHGSGPGYSAGHQHGQPPPSYPPPPPGYGVPPPRGRGSKVALIVAGAILLFAVLAVAVTFLARSGGTAAPRPEPTVALKAEPTQPAAGPAEVDVAPQEAAPAVDVEEERPSAMQITRDDLPWEVAGWQLDEDNALFYRKGDMMAMVLHYGSRHGLDAFDDEYHLERLTDNAGCYTDTKSYTCLIDSTEFGDVVVISRTEQDLPALVLGLAEHLR